MGEVSARKMVPGKLLEAAKVAEDQAHLERFSEALYELCVECVEENMRSVFEIFDSETPSGDASAPLRENCKHNPCLHGQVLTKDNFVIKAQVTRQDTHNLDLRETIQIIYKANNNQSDQVKFVIKRDGNIYQILNVVEISKFRYKC